MEYQAPVDVGQRLGHLLEDALADVPTEGGRHLVELVEQRQSGVLFDCALNEGGRKD